MRWTGWILVVIVVGSVGVAGGGQPCCPECGEYAAVWGPLSGEAGCSPPGLALSAWRGPSCCCANQQPCCDNAWDGYCQHHARAQAFWTQVGVPKTRCCPCYMPRTQMTVCGGCPQCSPATVQPTPSPAADAPAPSVQRIPAMTPVPEPSDGAPTTPLPRGPALPSVQPAPAAKPRPDSATGSPKPSATPVSASPSKPTTPPDEAFREIGQPWLR
jgi:hypothetical protein